MRSHTPGKDVLLAIASGSCLILMACQRQGTALPLPANSVGDASAEAMVARDSGTVARDSDPEALTPPTVHDALSAKSDQSPAGGFCGNGSIERGEECDDGNTSPGDGCSATCLLEDPWPCEGCPPPRRLICGNGLLSDNEVCDDGNNVAGDGCSADCQTVEPGWRCRVPSRPCAPICGDLVLTGTETCDDGNTDSGDGCSMHCLTEAGWECTARVCVRTGVDGGAASYCGDGVRSGAEECDLGVAGNSDTEYGGCTTRCWNGSFCGDGVVDSLAGGEECDLGRDNGATVGPDGCTVGCTRPHYCGDGIVDTYLGEECDLGERNGLSLDSNLNPTEPGSGFIVCWTGCVIPPSIHYDRVAP